MQNAKLYKRLLSCIYETLICIAIAMLVTLVFIAIFGDATIGIKRTVLQLILWLSIGVYFVQSWVKTGQTVAMRAWRLKLVQRHQEALTLQQAALRYVLSTLLMLTGISIVWALFDQEGFFLHDRLLGTRIVELAKG